MERENPFGIAPRTWKRVQSLRLMDDILMQTALDGCIPAVELILRIILGKHDLKVIKIQVEKVLPGLAHRELRLDITAVDEEGCLYNIEVQRSDKGALPRRPRFHSSLMDTKFLQKGMKTEDLPESFVIFITENDVLAGGYPVYHIDRIVAETGKPFGDGAHILYVNGAYQGEDEVGYLMSDFRATDPEQMHYDILAQQVKNAKQDEKGARAMSRIVEELITEGREEGYQQGIERGIEQGMKKGLEKGMEKGTASMLFRIMHLQDWPLEKAMLFAGLDLLKKPFYEEQIKSLQAG